MMKRNKWKNRRIWSEVNFYNKILISFLLIIFFLSGLSLLVTHFVSDVQRMGHEVAEESVPELLWLSNWQRDISTTTLALDHFSHHASVSVLEEQLEHGGHSPIDDMGNVPESLADVEREIERIDFIFRDRVQGLLRYNNVEAAQEVIDNELLPRLTEVEQELDMKYEQLYHSIHDQSETMSSMIERSLWVIFIGSMSAILLSIIFSYRLSHSFTYPLHEIKNQVQRISDGEYGRQVSDYKQPELADLISSINEMSTSLQESFELEKRMRRSEKLAVIGELAATSAHEIRNPLAVIQGFVQLLNDQLDEREKDKYHIPLMLSELERINHIVEELLLMSKPTPPQMTSGSLISVFDDIIPLIERNLPPQIEIKWDIHDSAVRVDRQQMKQVFHNLVRNSIEALGEEGEIRIYSQVEDDELHIFIRDNGPGIPEHMKDQLFEPFISSKEKGTGLGLTVIHRILHSHGGKIELVDTEEGTLFQLTLPITEDPSLQWE